MDMSGEVHWQCVGRRFGNLGSIRYLFICIDIIVRVHDSTVFERTYPSELIYGLKKSCRNSSTQMPSCSSITTNDHTWERTQARM